MSKLSGNFVHLRVHTEYSLVDSTVRVPELMEAVAGAGMPAVALTDECNLFAMVKFYREGLSRGVQPIIGVDIKVRDEEVRQEGSRLTLICQDSVGYGNLARLVTRAYLEGQDNTGVPMIERTMLDSESTRGLIALSGAQYGDIGQALARGREAGARKCLQRWLELFGDRFYIELQRLGRAEEESYIAAAVAIASAEGVPVVATNDVRFLLPDDFEAHEARVCIHEGTQLADPARPRHYTQQQFLRSAEQMRELFADLPEAVDNTVHLARRCSLTLKLGQARLPDYPVPAGVTPDQFLMQEARAGLQARFDAGLMDAARRDEYDARLERELSVIAPMGFAGYFLIVADFIRWAKANGVPVGPGRGSGAGSLVAYALGITDIEPLKYDLLFERFLNPERVSMPDFDVDFCMEGRDRVIDYVADKYGHERVSQIITYGTMAAKAVVRDVGRVLGMPYGQVDRIAKLIPFELGITLEDAIAKEPELKRLQREDEEVRNLLELARALEGLTRNAGKHAGGVVIAPSVLTDFTPLYCESDGDNVITQFDKDDVEAAGLVKFDFLGLRTLTVLDWALRTVNRQRAGRGEPALDLATLPMDDEATYRLLRECRTTAVFQLESRGMRDLMRRLQPDRFEDIIALVALFRPGPLQSGMVDDFIARKHAGAGAQIDYLHPELQPALLPTYGVILYQEQVMQIAQVLAGYTLGGADLLRRAMGKKKPEEMAKQRSVFVDGARGRGVDEKVAAHIFDLMEKFAGYGFNKSHSAAYALLSYQTAWLKAHHPAAFMAAVLSADMDRTDKIVTLIDDCVQEKLKVLPPDINASSYAFEVADDATIRYGLGAVRGVGRSAIDAVVEEREANGPFESLLDLCRRVDMGRVNRRVLEALIRSGSLDCLGTSRAALMHGLEAAIRSAEQSARGAEAGQDDLFGLGGGKRTQERVVTAPLNAPPVPEWTESQRLAGERETLGLFLTGHPIAPYEADLRALGNTRIVELLVDKPTGPVTWGSGDKRVVTVAGLLTEIRKRGNRVSFVLDDRSARIEVTMFDDVYQKHRDLVVKDTLLQVAGTMRFDEFSDSWRIAARTLTPLDAVRERLARVLQLRWHAADQGADGLEAVRARIGEMERILQSARGGRCAVRIGFRGAQATAVLQLDEQWCIRPTPEVIEQLERIVGAGGLRLVYGPAPEHSSEAMLN